MKNFRKLFVAAIMLVIALTAVVSSTYAWFTLQNEVDVNQMELNVGAAGKDLQISNTGGDDFSYRLTLTPQAQALTPVTLYTKVDGGETIYSFEKLSLNNDGLYEYASAKPFGAGAQEYVVNETDKDGLYLSFDLWFKTSSTGTMQVSLNVGEDEAGLFKVLNASTEQVLSSLRIAFVEVTKVVDEEVLKWEDAVIYEPFYGDGDNTYGKGEYFKKGKNWIAPLAFADFITVGDSADDYKLKPSWYPEYEYLEDVNDGTVVRYTDLTNNLLPVIELEANTPVQVRVFIWLEGWDGDTNNNIHLAEFAANLKFEGN